MEEYIKKLLEQVRFEKAHKAISDEIRAHIEDQAEAHISEGMDKETAEKRAVEDMGDPVETGIALDKVHRPQVAWSVVVATLVVAVLGIVLNFIVTPYVINDEQELVFNRLKEIAGENDIGFTNANHDYDAIGLDFEKDFMDESHLNYYGAEKFTEYLGKDIAGRFDLPDHRGEKRYKSWDANCLEIEKAVNAG